MSLFIIIEPEYGYITRNGVTTYEPGLYEALISADWIGLLEDEEDET